MAISSEIPLPLHRRASLSASDIRSQPAQHITDTLPDRSNRRSTVGRTHETENAGLRREANHGAVRRVVDPVDDPIRRDPQPEWNRHLPTTIDQHLVAVSVLPERYRSAIRNRAAWGTGAWLS